MLLLFETPSKKKKKNLTMNVTSMLTLPLRASRKKSQIPLFFKYFFYKSSFRMLPPHPHVLTPPY